MSSTTELLNAISTHSEYKGSVKSRVDDILDSILNNTEYKNGSRSELEKALIELKQVISTGGFGFNMSNWKYTRFNSKSTGVKKIPVGDDAYKWAFFCILDDKDAGPMKYVNLTLTDQTGTSKTFKITKTYKSASALGTSEYLNLNGTDQCFLLQIINKLDKSFTFTAEWEFF